MKGYKCVLPLDKLNEKREEFWKSRGEPKDTWKTIRHACLLDESNNKLLSFKSVELLF